MKALKIFTILFFSAVLFMGCDKVEEPYLVNKGPVGTGGGEIGKRVILLEEFTGHRCVNCPEAAILAQNLSSQYGDQLLVMSVHAGFYAMPLGELTADYRTATGTTLNDYFGITANPSGMVSRLENNGSRVLGKDEWQKAVEDLLDQDALASIAISSAYNTSSRVADITVDMEVFNPESIDYRFCLYVMEDKIVSPQKNSNPDVGPTPTIEDWEHRHVLRGDVNGTWGETIDAASGAASNTYSFTLPAEWNEENCAFIGFVYRDDTKEILHAAEVHVK